MLNKGQLEKFTLDLKDELFKSGFLAEYGPNHGAYREWHALKRMKIPVQILNRVLNRNHLDEPVEAYVATINPMPHGMKYFHEQAATCIYVFGTDEACPTPSNSYFYLSNPTIAEAGWYPLTLGRGPWHIPPKTAYGFVRHDWHRGIFLVVHTPLLTGMCGEDWFECDK